MQLVFWFSFRMLLPEPNPEQLSEEKGYHFLKKAQSSKEGPFLDLPLFGQIMVPFLPCSFRIQRQRGLTGTWFSTQHRLTLKIPHMEQGWCWDASTTSTAFVQPLLHHRLTSCFKKNNLRFYFKLKYRLLIQRICSINKYMNFLIQVEMLRH